MNCLSAKACGRWLPLHSITLQGCTSFRHLSFHSDHCQPPASATHARVFPFIPLRSLQPSISLRSPLAFLPTIRTSKPKREATFHPPQFAAFHSVNTLAFPHANQRHALRYCSPLKTKSLKNPRHPLMVQVKIKEQSRKAFVLAAGSSRSFNRSLGRSFLATPLTYSFRSPHQLQHPTCKCFVPQHPHFSPHSSSIPAYFYLRIVCPIKPVSDHCRFFQHLFSSHHAIEMRITAHVPPGASYFPFQQHIIIIPEICHFIFGKEFLRVSPKLIARKQSNMTVVILSLQKNASKRIAFSISGIVQLLQYLESDKDKVGFGSCQVHTKSK